jgi:hypothetical protein
MIANYVKAGLMCPGALGVSNNSVTQTSGTPIKNIVLVHGAWAQRARLVRSAPAAMN